MSELEIINNIESEFDEEKFTIDILTSIESYLQQDDASHQVTEKSSQHSKAALEVKQLKAEIDKIDESHQSAAAFIITDTIWMLGTQLNGDASKEESWHRLCLLVKEISNSNTIDQTTLKINLDIPLLVGAGLAKDEKTTQTMLVRINTRILYKQQKYNILREETEGYSKLLTVLAAFPVPAPVPGPSQVSSPVPGSAQVPQAADCSEHIRNVFSLIGQFDLDPNRVVDLILDALEQQPWNPSFLTLLQHFRRSSIVHLLGFKFTMYHSSRATGKGTVTVRYTPMSLYALAAVLVGGTLVSVAELLPYLSPDPLDAHETMKSLELAKTQEIMKVGVVSLNTPSGAPSGAPSLPIQGTAPTPLGPGTAPDQTPSPDDDTYFPEELDLQTPASLRPLLAQGNQYIGLLSALLTLRLWDDSEVLINALETQNIDVVRFEVVRDSLETLLLWMVSDIYTPVSITRLGLGPGTRAAPVSSGLPGAAQGPVPVLIPYLPRQMEKIKNLSDFGRGVSPFLRLLGHQVGHSARVFTVMCRLMKSAVLAHAAYCTSTVSTGISAGSASISTVSNTVSSTGTVSTSTGTCNSTVSTRKLTVQDIENNPELKFLVDLLTGVLVPGLTVSQGGAYLSSQVWSVLALLPAQSRYAVYDVWYAGKTGKSAAATGWKPQDVTLSEAQALQYAKASMKRLSRDNTKVIGRQLAVLTHYAPIVVFDYLLLQIEHYDNQIPYIVDALRYITDLSRDTLVYFLLTQLQRTGDRMRPGQADYTPWFASLCKFIGSFLKRYPSTEFTSILHLLVKKLSDGEYLDMLVLKDLLGIMGGSDCIMDVSQSQLEGLTGGRVLRAETMGAAVKDPPNKKAIKRLREELLSSGTALPLLLFMAKIRTRLAFTADADAPGQDVKLLGSLHDLCQDTLMQFADFLFAGPGTGAGSGSQAKNHESAVTSLPPLAELIDSSSGLGLGLSLPVAFQLTRPLLRTALSYGEDPGACPGYLQPWHPLNPLLLAAVAGQVQGVSPELFVLFWSLSLYDVSVPGRCYELEAKRLKERHVELDAKTKASASASGQNGAAMTAAEADKAKRQHILDMKKILSTLKDLNEEHESQRRNVTSTRRVLVALKTRFCPGQCEPLSVVEGLMQHCVFQRATLSPLDATFCSKFFFLLHEIETPRFSTLTYMDKVFKVVCNLLFCSTEQEASFIGFLLFDLLDRANRWAAQKTVFDEEAGAKSGFSSSFDDTCTGTGTAVSALEAGSTEPTAAPADSNRISFEFYEKIYKLWQIRLRTVLKDTLSSKEYMHVRCALIFISRIYERLPLSLSAGLELVRDVERIAESPLVDLQVMSKSVLSCLKRRMPLWEKDVHVNPGPGKDRGKGAEEVRTVTVRPGAGGRSQAVTGGSGAGAGSGSRGKGSSSSSRATSSSSGGAQDEEEGEEHEDASRGVHASSSQQHNGGFKPPLPPHMPPPVSAPVPVPGLPPIITIPPPPPGPPPGPPPLAQPRVAPGLDDRIINNGGQQQQQGSDSGSGRSRESTGSGSGSSSNRHSSGSGTGFVSSSEVTGKRKLSEETPSKSSTSTSTVRSSGTGTVASTDAGSKPQSLVVVLPLPIAPALSSGNGRGMAHWRGVGGGTGGGEQRVLTGTGTGTSADTATGTGAEVGQKRHRDAPVPANDRAGSGTGAGDRGDRDRGVGVGSKDRRVSTSTSVSTSNPASQGQARGGGDSNSGSGSGRGDKEKEKDRGEKDKDKERGDKDREREREKDRQRDRERDREAKSSSVVSAAVPPQSGPMVRGRGTVQAHGQQQSQQPLNMGAGVKLSGSTSTSASGGDRHSSASTSTSRQQQGQGQGQSKSQSQTYSKRR